ncbi:oxidoreductase [Amycolatopsis sp. NPDC021455]|uniref:oxidoreductase n=1 Tax=Amycolatopsis sp. NPDC021455 TaxID=3154901 RepID=UPI0033D3778B
MPAWTVRDISDQSGRTVVVTGANSGLGYHTVRELARRAARVVLACRNAERGAEAVRKIRAEMPWADVHCRLVDLADLTSVRSFAEDLDVERLDLLINNAGVMGVPRGSTRDGFETHIGINHLGTFALTCLLLPRLLATPGSRVVGVSSVAHGMAGVDPSRLSEPGRYNRWIAYGRSKTAGLLFTRELARRLSAAKATTIAVAAHPGYVATDLQAKAVGPDGPTLIDRMLVAGNRLVAGSPEKGALAVLYAACAPGLAPDTYVGPRLVGRGVSTSAWRAPWARDDQVGRRLWAESERLTGVRSPLSRTAGHR